MGTFRSYFRAHPWQRRLLGISAALIVGAAAAILAYAPLSDYLLIRRLGSTNIQTRETAIMRAIVAAQQSPATLIRIEDALDNEDDLRFHSLVRVLEYLGQFDIPQRHTEHIDRRRSVVLSLTRGGIIEAQLSTQLDAMAQVLLAGRANRHVRAAMMTAAGSDEPRLREMAAILAARLGDQHLLRQLVGDADPRVGATAALAAGMTGMSALAGDISPLLGSEDPAIAASAALALMRLDADKHAQRVLDLLGQTHDQALRDLLLYVVVQHRQNLYRRAEDVLPPAEQAPASAAQLWAAAALDQHWQHSQVSAALEQALADNARINESHLVAAIEAARKLRPPPRTELLQLCRTRWHPYLDIAMSHAAEALAEVSPDPLAPAMLEVHQTLQQGALYRGVSRSDDAPATPIASAAAAVALWRLGAADAEATLRAAVRDNGLLCAYVAAWRAVAAEPQRAWELGLRLLPPADAQAEERIYNEHERSFGAMLLAFSAQTPKQRAAAIARVRQRLDGGDFGGEQRLQVRAVYESALVALAQRQYRHRVGQYRAARVIPPSIPGAAMLLSGDQAVLDELLMAPRTTADDVTRQLLDGQLGPVIAKVEPTLAMIEAAMPAELRLWMLKVAQVQYGVRPRVDDRSGAMP